MLSVLAIRCPVGNPPGKRAIKEAEELEWQTEMAKAKEAQRTRLQAEEERIQQAERERRRKMMADLEQQADEHIKLMRLQDDENRKREAAELAGLAEQERQRQKLTEQEAGEQLRLLNERRRLEEQEREVIAAEIERERQAKLEQIRRDNEAAAAVFQAELERLRHENEKEVAERQRRDLEKETRLAAQEAERQRKAELDCTAAEEQRRRRMLQRNVVTEVEADMGRLSKLQMGAFGGGKVVEKGRPKPKVIGRHVEERLVEVDEETGEHRVIDETSYRDIEPDMDAEEHVDEVHERSRTVQRDAPKRRGSVHRAAASAKKTAEKARMPKDGRYLDFKPKGKPVKDGRYLDFVPGTATASNGGNDGDAGYHDVAPHTYGNDSHTYGNDSGDGAYGVMKHGRAMQPLPREIPDALYEDVQRPVAQSDDQLYDVVARRGSDGSVYATSEDEEDQSLGPGNAKWAHNDAFENKAAMKEWATKVLAANGKTLSRADDGKFAICTVDGVAGKYQLACVHKAKMTTYNDFDINFGPPFFARFQQRRHHSAVSRGLHHAARCLGLIDVLSAVLCPN